MKKGIVVGVIALAGMMLTGCVSSHSSSGVTNSANVVSPVKAAQSSQKRIWVDVESDWSNISENDTAENIYVTQNGKVNFYQMYGAHPGDMLSLDSWPKMSTAKVVKIAKKGDEESLTSRDGDTESLPKSQYKAPVPSVLKGQVRSDNGKITGEQMSYYAYSISTETGKLEKDKYDAFQNYESVVPATVIGYKTIQGQKYGYLTTKKEFDDSGKMRMRTYLVTKLKKNQKLQFDQTGTPNVSKEKSGK